METMKFYTEDGSLIVTKKDIHGNKQGEAEYYQVTIP